MIDVVERTELPVACDRIWHFFAHEVGEHYCDWHPEHLRWRWLRGRPLQPGSVWFADEWLGRLRVSGRFVVRDADPGRKFVYGLTFPASAVKAGGSFELQPTAEGCTLLQRVHIGFAGGLSGRLGDVLVRAVVPVSEISRHMREEQARLPDLLDKLDRAPRRSQGAG